MPTVVNNSSSPVMLKDGTVIGAAYTPEARREGVTLHEEDRRLFVRPDCLVVMPEPTSERVTLDLPAVPLPPKAEIPKSSETPANNNETRRRDSK